MLHTDVMLHAFFHEPAMIERCACGKKAAPGNHACYDCDRTALTAMLARSTCDCGKEKTVGHSYCLSCEERLIVEGDVLRGRLDCPGRYYETL